MTGGPPTPRSIAARPGGARICPADAMGGGECPINFCGTLKRPSALPMNQVRRAPTPICNQGRSCVVGAELPSGDGFADLRRPARGALAFGAACSPRSGAGAALRRRDSLCVASRGASFCSRLCRNGAAARWTRRGARSRSSYPTRALADGIARGGRDVHPEGRHRRVFPCERESECPAGRAARAVRPPHLDARLPAGGRGQVARRGVHAGNAECRSGECYDQGFNAHGAQRTRSGACGVNSDCSADPRCTRLVVGNNGTPDDPLEDDLVSGYCQTLFPPIRDPILRGRRGPRGAPGRL